MEIKSSKVRLNNYDNLKGIAIITIIIIHMAFLTEYTSVSTIKNMMFFIGLPIFFFISGYFSKIGPDEPIKAFKRLLIPYLLFCIIHFLFRIFILGDSSSKILFFNPEVILWFLISLFIIKLILPIVDKLKYPLIISIILSLLIGFTDINSSWMGITRVFTYLPVFLLGFYYKDYKFKLENKNNNILKRLLKIWNNKKVLICSLIIVLVMIGISSYLLPKGIIQMKYPYSSPKLVEMIERLIAILLGIGITLVLHKLVPNKETFLTKIGRNSMTVYLLHIYITEIIKKFVKHYDLFKGQPYLFLIFVLIIAFTLAFILSRDPITKYLNKFTDGIYNLITNPYK